MTVPAQLPTRPLARLAHRFQTRPWAALVEAAARAGYVARGAVWLSIGAIGLLAALDLTPRAQGVIGALEAWGRWPAGQLLLWLLGLGLYGFAGWRALQALLDVDRHGRSPRALATRLGQAISGATYAGLAISVFALVDAMEDLREANDQAATREAVARTLEMPFGDLAVMACGLFVLAVGLVSIGRAGLDHFGRDLDCDRDTRAWAGSVARIGYAGRGVALLPVGLLLVGAGQHARASEARGLGGALEAVAQRPYGEAVLALTAIGLVAFGLFALIEAFLRPMRIPQP